MHFIRQSHEGHGVGIARAIERQPVGPAIPAGGVDAEGGDQHLLEVHRIDHCLRRLHPGGQPGQDQLRIGLRSRADRISIGARGHVQANPVAVDRVAAVDIDRQAAVVAAADPDGIVAGQQFEVDRVESREGLDAVQISPRRLISDRHHRVRGIAGGVKVSRHLFAPARGARRARRVRIGATQRQRVRVGDKAVVVVHADIGVRHVVDHDDRRAGRRVVRE